MCVVLCVLVLVLMLVLVLVLMLVSLCCVVKEAPVCRRQEKEGHIAQAFVRYGHEGRSVHIAGSSRFDDAWHSYSLENEWRCWASDVWSVRHPKLSFSHPHFDVSFIVQYPESVHPTDHL